MTGKHVHWILLVSFCLNQFYLHYDSKAWPLDSIGVFLSESIVCALWQQSLSTGFYSCLFSESIVWASRQLCMATGLYWCLFFWITCMCIMTAMHVHWILLVSFCLNHLHVHYDIYKWPLDSVGVFCLNHLYLHYDKVSMSTGFYWCLFFWFNCMCIMTAMHGHWILLVSFCLNHLHVNYDSYAWRTGLY